MVADVVAARAAAKVPMTTVLRVSGICVVPKTPVDNEGWAKFCGFCPSLGTGSGQSSSAELPPKESDGRPCQSKGREQYTRLLSPPFGS